MAGEGISEQRVFFPGTASDVVNDERSAVGSLLVADDHDVGKIGRNGAGDEIAGKVVGGFLGDGLGEVATFEVGLQIWDAAVIDASVGLTQAPVFGILRKVRAHVLMNEFLEVLVQGGSEGPDDDVGADAAFFRNIAAGILETHVGGVVDRGDSDLFSRGFHDFCAGVRDG